MTYLALTGRHLSLLLGVEKLQPFLVVLLELSGALLVKRGHVPEQG